MKYNSVFKHFFAELLDSVLIYLIHNHTFIVFYIKFVPKAGCKNINKYKHTN